MQKNWMEIKKYNVKKLDENKAESYVKKLNENNENNKNHIMILCKKNG